MRGRLLEAGASLSRPVLLEVVVERKAEERLAFGVHHPVFARDLGSHCSVREWMPH